MRIIFSSDGTDLSARKFSRQLTRLHIFAHSLMMTNAEFLNLRGLTNVRSILTQNAKSRRFCTCEVWSAMDRGGNASTAATTAESARVVRLIQHF
jgi:hypothetical protein